MFLAGPTDWEKICSAATLALGTMLVLSIAGINYQESLISVNFKYPEFISEMIWLSPIVVLFISRNDCVAAVCYAIPISTMFFARIYFVSLLYFYGVNSAAYKGDWAALFTTLVGSFSVVILVLWLVARIFISVSEFLSRFLTGSDGENQL
jgi:hypothetical protein